MAIKILNKRGAVVAEGNTNLSGAVATEKRIGMMVYIDYTKGSEDSVSLSYEVKDVKTGKYYPLMQDNAGTLTAYGNTLNATGKYRIYLPLSANEDELKVNVQMNGNTATEGTIEIYCIPDNPS